MLTLPLEPTDDRANPAFRDVASCEKWLTQLQFTNLHAVHNLLRTQIEELNRFPMRVLDRLNTLEKLRETVSIVQGDYAKKLIAKKLPLSDEEHHIFNAIIGMWQAMLTGYQRCLQDFMDGNNQLEKYGAMLCQRFMLYGSLQIIEHLRNGYEFDGALWQQLHALHSFTEGNGLQHEKIKDPLYGASNGISCQSLYAKILLTCLARPSELSRAQLQLMDRWLNTWVETLTLERRYMTSKGDAPPLAVDLRSSTGLQSLQQIVPSDNIRYMAMVPLSKLLRVKLILLQQGQDPRQLELGDEFFGVDCLALLKHLLQMWCEGNSDRSAERQSVTVSAQVACGFEQICAQISGKPLKASRKSGKSADIDTAAYNQIAAVGHVFNAGNQPAAADILESWTIENESILGARLIRDSKNGERIGNNQIIALRTPDAKAFMLGVVSWRTVTLSGQLRMGVQYMPGVAEPVVLKITEKDADGPSNRNISALLLPSLPTIKIPASILMPRNIFHTGRIAELIHNNQEKISIKMGFSVQGGADFERISFIEEKSGTA